jgi:hypothetical protein
MAEEKFQYTLTLATQATGNGAKQTADELNRVRSATAGAEDAMERLGAQAPRTAAQIDKVADSTKQLGTSSSYNKGGGNAGTAILEASRALEDLQFGLRGVLNNIPSLIFALGGSAGLAGVISVAAVSASVLWTKFSGGAKKAKEDTGDLIETFKQLVEVYTELDQTNAEDRQKAAETAAKGLQTAINSISLGQLITGNRAGLTAAREVAAASLQLAQDRIRLAEVEKATTLASGNDAVRLAREREAIISRILESERAITEAGRQRELSNAQDKVAGAQAKVDATKQSDTVLAEQARLLQTQYTELRSAAEEETRIRVAGARAYNEELDAARAALAARSKELELDPNRLEILAPFEAAVNRLQAAVDALAAPTPSELQKFAEAEIPFNSLKELQPALDSSAEAQREAARAMTEASLALSNLRQSQEVTRTSEAEQATTQEIGRVGAEVTQTARDAIAAILANAQTQGRAPSAGEQQAISGIQQIITDTTPDAQQGGQLAGLIQVLANNLTAKDAVLAGGINQIITTAKTLASKYQGLADRINDLQNQVNQLK